MKKIYIPIILIVTVFAGVVGWRLGRQGTKQFQPEIVQKITRPLEKYTIENLAKANIKPADLSFNVPEKKFSMKFETALDGQIKTVSGQARYPLDAKSSYPVIIMVRGYVDKEIYQSGIGTQKAAEVFSQNGFITLAPDFLGYADSDQESPNILEARFQTYTTILSLLASVNQIPNWDGENVFLWGHSNGGQIALTILEITQKAYPTSLWAPVSKPFPYSVLYYTDEAEDKGKFLRREIANFEEIYNSDAFSIHKFYDKINKETPIQIHQGTADDAVPPDWSKTLFEMLKNQEIKVNYFVYPGSDHNLRPASPSLGGPAWNTVVQRDLDFFRANRHNN